MVESFRFKTPRGITLVEVLVVTAIVGLLVSVLLPALASARAAAFASGATSHLSAFGRGFEIVATNDHLGRYCTGAFDHLLDGDIRSRGWVADLVNAKLIPPGAARDPANRWRVSETVADYTGAAKLGAAPLVDGSENGWATSSYASVSGSGYFGGPQQMNDVWDAGFNTTFATTWHFSRGDPPTSGNLVASGYDSPSQGPSGGDGPLSQATLDAAATTAARVALMGPARATDGPDFVVRSATRRLRSGVADGKVNEFVGFRLVRPADLMLESFTDGMKVDFSDTALGGQPGQKIHDMHDIHPLHMPKRHGGGGFAPILFADGHVSRVHDTVTVGDPTDPTPGDGCLGNGVVTDAAGNITGTMLDAASFAEVNDQIWVKRLRIATLPDGRDVH
jgi:prepilin-type processing-associated H-X9-DG protein/prepilin-type N-terminal cleavage/methylation domain-containing protein